MKIVYCSKTGHTKRYAEMLSKALDIKNISIEEYTKDDDKIVFMGWVSAGQINGYKKVNDSNKLCTIAVGLSPNMKDNNDKLISQNNVKEEFFYLQGGLDYTKLKGPMRFIYKTIGRVAIRNCKEENIELFTMFANGGDFIKEENLKDIISYIKKGEKV